MTDDKRQGKDEMNLAVLPIARLGRNDRRTRIEYHGTFKEPGKEQESMVWIVEGAAGLPTEFAERVMVGLLYLGAQDHFRDRKVCFTVYKVLKVLGLTISNRNYRMVEKALKQLAGVLITSDKAWVEHTKDGQPKRVTTSRGFHVIDEYFLHYQEEDEDEPESYVVWGARLWKSIQAGYLKMLDIDFYYSIENPLARRLYRFLDKMMGSDPGRPYQIDIFDLANKLGMAQYEHAAHLRRPLKTAAQELVDKAYLAEFEFVKVGKFSRIRFYRSPDILPLQLPLLEPITDTTNETITKTEEDMLWDTVLTALSPTLRDSLRTVRLLRVEEGIAIIEAGAKAEWLQSRTPRALKQALKLECPDITEVHFIAHDEMDA